LTANCQRSTKKNPSRLRREGKVKQVAVVFFTPDVYWFIRYENAVANIEEKGLKKNYLPFENRMILIVKTLQTIISLFSRLCGPFAKKNSDSFSAV
jgi:hypothetical protein